jgi:type II secretory pathway component GspD/PulD (secretin)
MDGMLESTWVRPPLPLVLLGLVWAASAWADEAWPTTEPMAPVEQADAAPAAEASTSDRVTNMFYETSLRQALSDIAAQTGAIIIPGRDVQGIVTVELRDVPLEKALQIVLAGTGFTAIKRDGYYLVAPIVPDDPSWMEMSETCVVRLNHVTPEEAAKLLPAAYEDYIQTGNSMNKLTINARPEVVKRITADLADIDVPQRHVLLDCRIVVLEHSTLLNLGIDWDFPSAVAGAFTTSDLDGEWPWAVTIGYTPGQEFTNSLLLTLNLLRQNEEATIMATPEVLAMDGRKAELRVAREEYFRLVTGGFYERAELEKIESGTVLKIIPHITEQNDIILEMAAEVSDVVARGETNLPVVTRRSATSTVRIQDGGTSAVAGLMDARSRRQDSKVPGFSAIPLLGRLFENTSDSTLTRQIAIFVTARIVPDTAPPEAPSMEPTRTLPLIDEELFRVRLMAELRRMQQEM